MAAEQQESSFVSALASLDRASDGGFPAPLRREALDAFRKTGLPTPRHEDWKYTNLVEVSRSAYLPLQASGEIPLSAAERHFLPDATITRLTFVDGHYSAALSKTDSVMKGITFSSFSAASGKIAELAQSRISKLATVAGSPLHALNTALFSDGAIIHAEKGASASAPIHILFLSSGKEKTLLPTRTLIVAEEAAHIAVIETYAGVESTDYLSSTVTEIYCAQRSNVDHTKIQREGAGAVHLGSLVVEQETASRFSSHAFSFGSRLVRNEIAPILNGQHIECFLNGLTVIGDQQHVDNTTIIDHAKPNCFSRELYKGIYADRSSGVFSGTIIVREDAQKTNAIQSNKSLLLSPDATIDTRPQLKIYADDVKCTHGATVGQLDEDALFYLRSRGISGNDARNMLIHAFAGDIIQYVPTECVRDLLETALLARLNESALVP